MRKLFAITLLIVHLFNLAGYPFLFRHLMAQSTLQLSYNIDKDNYDEAQLKEIKVALNLPYITPYNDYQRFEGEIAIGGKNYSYVKRKVSNDTLYLLCLPNTKKDRLQTAADEFGTVVNNFDDEKPDNTVKKLNILNQYHLAFTDYAVTTPLEVSSQKTSELTSILPDFFIDSDGRPPQLNS